VIAAACAFVTAVSAVAARASRLGPPPRPRLELGHVPLREAVAHEASLLAENRAVEWHLDVGVTADRALIELLLAPDRAGAPHALAPRMGVGEIVWDCRYRGAGMEDFRPDSPCLNRNGDLPRHVDATIARRNHLHIGMSEAGAAKRTSFWTAAAAG
jgi:hypothetical protein